MATPTTADLKRAITITEQIEKLQAELNSILGGSGKASTGGTKRGRKPGRKGKGADADAGAIVKAVKKAKRNMSPEARAKIAEAQKKRWAAQKKAAK